VSRKSSGDGDLPRLSTTSNKVEDSEIRAILLSDSICSDEIPVPHSAQHIMHCPHCQSETFLGDKFCQECGGVQPAFEEQSRLSPEFFLPVLADNSKLLFVSIGVCLAVVLVVSSSVLYFGVTADLEKALSANKLNDAVVIADRLNVSRFGSLSGLEAELFSDAFFRRAQVFAANKNYQFALADLIKVLPSYSKHAQAMQLRSICALFLAQKKSVTTPMVVESKLPATKSEEQSRSVAPQRIKAIAPIGNLQNNQAEPHLNRAEAQSNRAEAQLNRVEAKNTQSVLSKRANGEAMAVATNSERDEVDSEEADMAAYNRHLADYFTRKESKSSKASATSEPPSFSEWVQSGKSEF
jgi:hypothetical protein